MFVQQYASADDVNVLTKQCSKKDYTKKQRINFTPNYTLNSSQNIDFTIIPTGPEIWNKPMVK
jgi:hypothetical protein